MNNQYLDERIKYWLGIFTFVIVAILAAYYARERTFGDGATEIVDVISRGSVFPFILHPLLSLKLFAQLPLYIFYNLGGAFVNYPLIYSLGYILPNLIAFFVIFKYFNRPLLALISPLILILDQNSNFFFIASIGPAFPLLLLYLAASDFILKNTSNLKSLRCIISWAISIYASIVLSINHPTTFVLLGLLMGKQFLFDQGYKNKSFYFLIFLSAVTCASYFLFFTNPYAKAAIGNANFSIESFQTIGSFLWHTYKCSLILLIFFIGFSLFNEKISANYEVAYWIGALCLFVLYVNVGVKIDGRSDIYARYAYSGFVFLSLLILYKLMHGSEFGLVSVLIFAVILVFQVVNVQKSGRMFSERLKYLSRAANQCISLGSVKCMVSPQNIPLYARALNMHYKTESLIASSGNSFNRMATITPSPSRKVIDAWLSSIWPDFSLQQDYKYLNSSSSESIASISAELELESNYMVVKKNKKFKVNLKIKNLDKKPISSISYSGRPIKISYHIFKEGKVVSWDGLRTPIEFDVYRVGYQPITIKAPAERGVYLLSVDLVVEGAGWLRKNSTAEFTVK